MPALGIVPRAYFYRVTRAWPLRAMLLWVLLLLSFGVNAEWYSHSGEAMGTKISVEFWHSDAEVAAQAKTAVMDEMHRIDQAFSPWIDSSELAQLNRRAAGGAQTLSSELAMLIDRSLFYSQLTNGAFDITFASVGRLYDYRAKQQPSQAKAEALLPAVNFRELQFNKQRRTLAFGLPNMQIDLGGIAKGYAVDQAIEILVNFGVEQAAVSAGGDSRLLGDKRGRPWIIGIKKPRSLPGDDEPAIALPLADAAVSTSGDYERYFVDPDTGERVHHIINPRTGRSAQGPVSVTVIGREAIDTDALSTSVFVMGVDEGLALVNSLPGFECIIINNEGRVFYSDGLVEPTAP